ncbi:MAG: alpha/beta fold hydrolase [Gammaproteobacteria bacterium]|nr:alpha/beta fold hydrolase [Gammaproteobacteria bacterium]MCY3816822.1 alpha/beta fold hydrolase [Gammaproteobacteria bacterium]
MRRRMVIGGLIGGAVVGSGKWISTAMAEGEDTVSTEEARYAGVGEEWKGAAALAGGKGYAQCRLGALHYRHLRASSGDAAKPTILLLHQTPFGLAEWVDIQPMLTEMGHDTIAPDNPGYGMSDPPPDSVTIADLADNLVDLLDHLDVKQVAVAGHHTGASIAASFAARHAERTACVVLHGCPVYDEAGRASRLAQAAPQIHLREDGSHLADIFSAIHSRAPFPQGLSTATWGTLGAWWAGFDTPTYRAVFANDMAEDLDRIRTPTRILTDRGDSLHEQDKQAAARRSEFSLEVFSDGGSFSLMLGPQKWAERVAAFVSAG